MNDKRFNLTDLWYLLLRSSKNSIIRGWKFEFMKAFCLFCGVLICIMLYPNDIGSDPSCSIDLLNEFNLTQITDQVYHAINGKRSKGEMNVSFLSLLLMMFSTLYIASITFNFPDQIKVSK